MYFVSRLFFRRRDPGAKPCGANKSCNLYILDFPQGLWKYLEQGLSVFLRHVTRQIHSKSCSLSSPSLSQHSNLQDDTLGHIVASVR